MDQQIIAEKIESLRRCISRIEEKRPANVDELQNNIDLQDIISVNLERAVQVCVDIGSHIIAESNSLAPTTMGETFNILNDLDVLDADTANRLKKAVGFRNIAVHNYQKISWEIVFNISHHRLDDFKNFAKMIQDYVF